MFAFSREEILKRAELHKRMIPVLKNKALLKGLAGLFVLIFSIGFFIFSQRPNAYAVLLDGKQVAVVETKGVAEEALRALLAEKTEYVNVAYREELAYQDIKVKTTELTSPAELQKILSSRLTLTAQATAINVEGKDIAYVASEAVANDILQRVKDTYTPKASDSIIVQEIKIEEKVTFRNQVLPVQEIDAADKVISLLVNGVEEMHNYVVQEGDNLWDIARANGMSVEELMQANPELKSDKLSLEQNLKLVKAEPLLHVVTTLAYKTTEKIPFDTKVERDSSMLRGQQKVKTPGVDGLKEVQYTIVKKNGVEVTKEKLAEKVVQQPVMKVVVQGTKVMLASRGDGGSGQLAWPHRGKITSGYGYRGREFHTGIDIDGTTGQPIYAAEDGVVTFAGYAGGYGYMVTIDHGDGLATRYAHNSKNKVSVGDKVKRGDLIALLGSTGRSTGSHVHFEVLVNGSTRNPLSYLK